MIPGCTLLQLRRDPMKKKQRGQRGKEKKKSRAQFSQEAKGDDLQKDELFLNSNT